METFTELDLNLIEALVDMSAELLTISLTIESTTQRQILRERYPPKFPWRK